MDRRQLVVQRTREYFGDRLDDVLAMIRQDRQELRGWQEPAHVRAVVRRAVREGGNGENATAADTVTVTQPEASGRAGILRYTRRGPHQNEELR